MPLLSTNQYGAGYLYTFTPGDPNAFLAAGVSYYQTANFFSAILMFDDIIDANFTVAGSIGSRYYGLYSLASGRTNIAVTSTGYLAGDYGAIGVFGDQTFNLENFGTIASAYGDAIYMFSALTSRARITNAGTISSPYAEAIETAGGDDVVVNTGTIIGNVFLGVGSDRFDTHLGDITGIINGGAGNDSYVLNGTEQLVEYLDEGDDTVQSYSDYALGANVENLTLLGDARVGNGNRLDNQIVGNGLDNILAGYRGDDFLDGGSGDDVLGGGAGNDTLYGNNGNNQMFGGAGDDVLVASGVGDTEVLNGGAGVDLAQFYFNTGPIIGNLVTQRVTGEGLEGTTLLGIEGLYGSAFNDRLTGSAEANYLFGNAGNDDLFGLNGDDRIEGSVGADQIDGDLGVDTAEYINSALAVTVSLKTGRGTAGDALGDRLFEIENVTGSAYDDTIGGNDFANVLRGGNGADTLNGGDGTDTLFGDAGNDALSGGLGADVFAFQDIIVGTPGGWGSDRVTGFVNGEDKIGFLGTSAINAFGDLTISADGADTLITYGLDVIRLVGFATAALDPTDFVFG